MFKFTQGAVGEGNDKHRTMKKLNTMMGEITRRSTVKPPPVRDEMEKYIRMAAQVRSPDLKPRGIRMFRTAVWVVLCPLFMYKGLLKKRIENRTMIITFITTKYPEAIVRSREWMLRILGVPLARILKSASNFRVGAKKSIFGGRYKLSNSNIEEIRMLVRGTLESLTDIPPSLEAWIVKIAKPFTFLPNSYMLPYERARLQFDYVGAVCNHAPNKR
jgi:hypothetical protein